MGKLDQDRQHYQVDHQRRKIDGLEPPQICQEVTTNPEDHEPVEHEGDEHGDHMRTQQRHQIALLAQQHQEPCKDKEPNNCVDCPDYEKGDALVTDDPQEPTRRSGPVSYTHLTLPTK